jgi:hypothetical protein
MGGFDFDINMGLGTQDLGVGIEKSDIGIFDIQYQGEEGADTYETRYIKPTLVAFKRHMIKYEHADKLGRELKMGPLERYDVIVSGNFVFGDFIYAWMTHQGIKAKTMTISTLSMGTRNVDVLAQLMKTGYIQELNLVVSAYFYRNYRNDVVPYIYEKLDDQKKNNFQMGVAGIHTKTMTMETEDGMKIVMQGSANLRSSANIEQFILEDNPEVYDFYKDYIDKIIEKYATIKKPIRCAPLWNEITKKKIKD